jgi:hypothetical protein
LPKAFMRALSLLVALALGSAASGCRGRLVGLSADLDAASADAAVTRRGTAAASPDAGFDPDVGLPGLAAARECPEGGADAGETTDASVVVVAPDGATCHGTAIRASDYDQSCAMDSDCVEVTEGNSCVVGGCGCGGVAINRCALPRYQADLEASGVQFVETCNCPADFGACCRGGRCVDNFCCLNACPDAGDR